MDSLLSSFNANFENKKFQNINKTNLNYINFTKLLDILQKLKISKIEYKITQLKQVQSNANDPRFSLSIDVTKDYKEEAENPGEVTGENINEFPNGDEPDVNPLKDPMIKEEEEEEEQNDRDVLKNFEETNKIPSIEQLNYFYSAFCDEINNVYISYSGVERDLYIQVNKILQSFNKINEFGIIEILKKLITIKKMLENTRDLVKFVNLNMDAVKMLMTYLDTEISSQFKLGSFAIVILRKKFDMANSDLNYILQYKIIDEVSGIMDNLKSQLIKRLKYIKSNKNKNVHSSSVSEVPLSETDSVPSSINNEEGNNDNIKITRTMSKDDEALAKLIENSPDKVDSRIKGYQNEIDSLIQFINDNDKYRAKYVNLAIFVRYGFKSIISNKMQGIGINLEDATENLQINSLMDEEMIIKNFISKNSYKNYIRKCTKYINKYNYRNLNIILMHYGFYYVLFSLTVFSNRKMRLVALYITMIYLGKFIGRIFFGFIMKNKQNYKLAIIISSVIYVLSFIISLITQFNILKKIENQQPTIYEGRKIIDGETEIEPLLILARFLFGVTSADNVDNKYIITFAPRNLIKVYIKKFQMSKILGNLLGYTLCTIIFIIEFLNDSVTNENPKRHIYLKKVDIASDIVCLSLTVILLLWIFIRFTDTSLPIFSIVNPKYGIELPDRISVGQRKIINSEENDLIIESNKLFSDQNKANKFNDNNSIQPTVQMLIKNEVYHKCGYIAKGFYGLIVSLFLCYFIEIVYILIICHRNRFNSFGDIEIKSTKEFLNSQRTGSFVFMLAYFIYFLFLFTLFKKIKLSLSKKKYAMLGLIIIEIILTSFAALYNYLLIHNVIVIEEKEDSLSIQNIYLNIICIFIYLIYLIVERLIFKLFSKLIPQSWTFLKLNVCLFVELYENFIKIIISFVVFLLDNDFSSLSEEQEQKQGEQVDKEKWKDKVLVWFIIPPCITFLCMIVYIIFMKNLNIKAISRLAKKNYGI